MQKIGDATRAEALAGVSDKERALLFQILKTMKGNLAEACMQGVEAAREVTEEELDHA
jgi:hypothetical protein